MKEWFNTQVPVWMAALSDPSLWWQVGAALVCLLLAWMVDRRYDAWLRGYLKCGDHTRAGLATLAACRRLAFPAALSLLLLLAWVVYSQLQLRDALLWVSLSLAVAFLLVRLAVYLLSGALKPGSLLRASENVIVAVVWVGVALYLLGWMPAVLDVLDRAAVQVGGTRVSILLVLRALSVALLVVVLTLWLSRLLERKVRASNHLSPSAQVGITKVLQLVLLVLGAVIALQVLGVNLAALAVIGGTLGLGLGLGLQRIVSNFISGFILLVDGSVKPGDVVTVEDASGTRYGWVQELRARYIVIRDRDGVDTLMPNENLIINSVVNWSYGGAGIRLKIPTQISYADDPERAMALLEEAARSHERVLADPPPAARLMAFGDNGIDLELRVWLTAPELGMNNVRSDINLMIWRAFKANGITHPFPQREVRMLAPESD
ncbi:MAG: mechanosensitive ion channel family protein [Lysobacter sp.]